MMQHAVVFVAVLISAVYLLISFVRALRSFLRTASGESSGCGGGCAGCGCSKSTAAPARREPAVIPLSAIGMAPKSRAAGDAPLRPMIPLASRKDVIPSNNHEPS